MEAYIDSLLKCVLFKDMNKDEVNLVLKNIPNNIQNYNSEDTIAIEGESCDNLGIILTGNIEIHKSFASGKLVTINHFEAGNIFGEALVFSGKHQYPATIISSNPSSLMFISRDDIVKLMTLDTRILNNFMGVLSNRILMLNQRLTNLTLDTLRKKISNIILLEYNKQKSKYITLPYSRKKMAEMLNIPRPSLSRELSNMKDDGLIDFYKNRIKILDIKGLEDSLSK
ncbi:Crp/Fnr family transcriptional regulator [Tissierella sp. Yu-01]|jgi:CRP-like cAMP-binding protein|uniref:Crp/Fnr family transcriptional regulator n=1 Tax=Tissierella sp. Yu-01 TaxID=3035694 RepID=UPI00240DA3EE|nr:Crp/Fnr family transcriptional regulator [Tissierella sp. Yu-01]WFA10389.1 Crp/Fnr family transcriptional regulator [Tissierella sp. Yu-01]